MAFYKLTPYRAAHFFGQTGHETNSYKAFSENLNYSASGLKKIFRKYFLIAYAAAILLVAIPVVLEKLCMVILGFK